MGYEETLKAVESGRVAYGPSYPVYYKMMFLLALIGTNLMTYFFVAPGDVDSGRGFRQAALDIYEKRSLLQSHLPTSPSTAGTLDIVTVQLNQSSVELSKTQKALASVERELREVKKKAMEVMDETGKAMEIMREMAGLIQTNVAVRTTPEGRDLLPEGDDGFDNDLWREWSRIMGSMKELAQFIQVRKLPLGWSPGLASDSIVSPVGHACALHSDELRSYTEFYDVGSECPDDHNLAQRLLLHGCEPLPRRRCFTRLPKKFQDPYTFPKSLWTIPPNDNIDWSPYTCKSFECLNDRKNKHVVADCLDCFELGGREKGRWIGSGGRLDFSINEVLALKNGSIRIGLDIGGGSGSFAVRMKENDVTIVTTTMNFDGPFNNMIAHRGVIPLYMSISQRLPFFDNTLDIVHSMHVLSNWIPLEMFEFILFDIDRILRPGGIFWLDHFFCIKNELNDQFVPLIEKLGYKKLKWAIGNKLDKGPERQEVYLSALLEKPYSR